MSPLRPSRQSHSDDADQYDGSRRRRLSTSASAYQSTSYDPHAYPPIQSADPSYPPQYGHTSSSRGGGGLFVDDDDSVPPQYAQAQYAPARSHSHHSYGATFGSAAPTSGPSSQSYGSHGYGQSGQSSGGIGMTPPIGGRPSTSRHHPVPGTIDEKRWNELQPASISFPAQRNRAGYPRPAYLPHNLRSSDYWNQEYNRTAEWIFVFGERQDRQCNNCWKKNGDCFKVEGIHSCALCAKRKDPFCKPRS